MNWNALILAFLLVILSACVGGGSSADPEGASPPNSGGANPSGNFNVILEQYHSQEDPTENTPIRFKVDFERVIDVASFVPSDILQNGTAPGVSWKITQLDSARSFFIDGTPTDSGTVIPTIPAGKVRDVFGNSNKASYSLDNSVQYNYVPVTVSVDQAVSQIDPACETNIVFDVVFGVAIDPSTFTVEDINQSGTATGITWTITNSGDDTNFTLEATVVTTAGTIIPSISADTVLTPTGKPNIASTSTDNNVTFATNLSANINQTTAQTDPAAALPIEYELRFCRAIDPATFTTTDITQNGSATGVTWNIVNSGDDKNFTVQATAVTNGGTVVPTLAAAVVQDPGAVPNTASTSTDNSVLYDNKVNVTIEQAVAQTDPTSSLPVVFDIQFENAIDPATFSTLDIVQNGTATGITWNLINSGDDTNFTLQATAITGQGTVIPTIAANNVSDPLGTLNAASTSADNEVTYHTTFDVTVEQAVAQLDPTATLPAEFTITFTESIDPATFTIADITQNGTATGVTWNLINSGDGTIYTLQATGVTGQGTLVPSINASIIQTTYGAQNKVSTSTDNSVLYSTTYTVTIDQGGSQADPANVLPVEFDVVFERAIDVATFTIADITQNGTASGITWNIINSGDDINFTLQATAITSDGTVIPSIDATLIKDTGGANNLASTSTDNSVLYENILIVNIEQKVAQADPTNTLPIEYDVVFNRPIDVSTFTSTDITQNGTATGVTWNIINSGDDTNFTLQATATTSDGTVIPSIAANLVNLAADPAIKNQVSTATDNDITYDTTPPVVTITTPAAPGTWHSTTIDIDGTCDEVGGTVNLTLDGGTVTDTASCDGANWSIVGLDISSIADATGITIAADLDDAAGNSATQDTETFNKDTVAPSDVTAVTLSVANNALFTRARTANWSTATDADSGLSHYMYAIGTSSGGEEIMSFTDIGSGITYSALSPADFASQLQTDQDYFISIKAVDNAGNESGVLTSPAWKVFNWIKVTGSSCAAGTDLNQAAASPMLWSSTTTSSGYFTHSTSSNSDQITVTQAGDYTVNVNIPLTSAVQRAAINVQVYVNGAPRNYAVGQSTYIRNMSDHSESTAIFNGHLTLAANDIVTIRVRQLAANGVVNSPGATTYMEYIKPAHNIFSARGTQTVAGTNLNQASPFQWATEIQKDAGYTHAAGSQSVTLTGGGDYLVYVNIPLNGSVARAAPQFRVKLNGADVPGAVGSQGYIRNSGGHNDASLHFSGLISATAGQVLTVEMSAEAATAGTITVPAGLEGHIYIQELNTSPTNMIALRGTNTTAGTDWNSAPAGTDILWSNQDLYDNVVYSHIVNTSTITVGEDGNYLLIYNDHLTSTGQRPNPKIRVNINGIPLTHASCSTHYIRSSNGHNESTCSMVIMLNNLTTGDNIMVDAMRESTTTNATTAASDAKLFIIKKAE